MNGSDDEVLELGAISDGLSAEDVSEDGNNDVVGVVLGGLDDGVGEEELNSDVLEAVGGEEHGNSFPLDGVSDLDSGLVGLAFVEHGLSFLHKGKHFNEEVEVLVLNRKKSTFLSSSSFWSSSGLTRSKTLEAQSSCLATALSLSSGLTAKRQTRREAKRMTFISINL